MAAARMISTKTKPLLSKQSRIVAYLPNLKSAVRHFRAFSSYDEKYPDGSVPEILFEGAQSDLPDPHLGPLATPDQRFPMPGLVGPAPYLQPTHTQQPVQGGSTLMVEQLLQDRHAAVLEQFANTIKEEVEAHETEIEELEYVAQDCPELIKKDFQDLFPEQNLSSAALTVITLSQKTRNDMSGWSEEVEEEREALLEQFVCGAEGICEALHEAGFWADFVDPSSGRPYLGAYTNATLYETDERYRHFGFEIDDLGCCKVISHHLWGSHAYVGALFTNAPANHPLLVQMKKMSKNITQ